MFQNITINSILDKITSTSKPYKACEVQDESGAVFKVNVFSDFPDFANLRVGSVLRGQLVQKGQYTNLLSETQGKGKFGASGGFKQAQIKEVMDIKREGIQKFADNKEHAIKLASTLRMATDLAIAEGENRLENTFQETIRKYRSWLWAEWDNINEAPPFND